MLTKEQCEVILSRCMQSEADFAELFEEDTTSEGISMLNGCRRDEPCGSCGHWNSSV